MLQMPSYVEEESNRSLAFAKHFHENIEEMLKHVPVRCRDFTTWPSSGCRCWR